MVTGSKVRDLENDVPRPQPCDIRGERGVLTRGVLLLRGRTSFFVEGSEGEAGTDPKFQLSNLFNPMSPTIPLLSQDFDFRPKHPFDRSTKRKEEVGNLRNRSFSSRGFAWGEKYEKHNSTTRDGGTGAGRGRKLARREWGEGKSGRDLCVCVCVRGTSVRTLLLRTNGIKGRRWNRITPDLESRALPFDFYRIRSQILSDVSADGQHLSNCARPLGHGGWGGGGGGREPFQSPDS